VPNSLRVSAEPSVTFDGATTVFTYTVTADTKGSLVYTAEGQVNANTISSYKAQSIEALIYCYGNTNPPSKGLFNTNSPPTAAPYNYPLQPSVSPYVIIPLDTPLIREHLKKKVSLPVEARGDDADVNDIELVWVEENPTIGEVDVLDATGSNNWKDGTYQDTGIRIGGIHSYSDLQNPPTISYIASTIGNFADGKDGRILSIATVLADEEDQDGKRYTSTISFYISIEARDMAIRLNAPIPSLEPLDTAEKLKLWMNDNKPALRVVYEWADSKEKE
jgi:hypothetical protein